MYALGNRMPIKYNYDLICKTVKTFKNEKKNELYKIDTDKGTK